jgi:hypothetical protein
MADIRRTTTSIPQQEPSMNKTTTSLAVVALATIMSTAAFAGNGAGPAPAQPATRPAAKTTFVYTAPTAVEAADMLYMREEEKLARDVYIAMYEAWELVPFAPIAVAEQSHMDAMLRLLTRYQLADPVAGKAAGDFTDPTLQALYTSLLAEGLLNPASALAVGARIEEIDLQDNADAIANSTLVDADAVYSSLMCGSRNHLRSFASTLELVTGQPYSAQVLTQVVVDGILASPMERCGAR